MTDWAAARVTDLRKQSTAGTFVFASLGHSDKGTCKRNTKIDTTLEILCERGLQVPRNGNSAAHPRTPTVHPALADTVQWGRLLLNTPEPDTRAPAAVGSGADVGAAGEALVRFATGMHSLAQPWIRTSPPRWPRAQASNCGALMKGHKQWTWRWAHHTKHALNSEPPSTIWHSNASTAQRPDTQATLH